MTSLEENDILFIDEIHRLNNTVEEILYPAMEDGELDIIIGKGPSAKSIRIELPAFIDWCYNKSRTFECPTRDRFGVSHKMEYYNIDEIRAIIIRGAKFLGVKINDEAAIEISKRSRGTPRIANRLLKRVRDYCEIKGNGIIDLANAKKNALDMLGVDSSGLDELDRNIINSIIENYDGGPVGIETLSLLLGEDRRTLEEVYEPYLVKIGFLKELIEVEL